MMHEYSDEEKEFLEKFVPGHTRKEITEEFNRRFGTDVSIKGLSSAYRRYGFSTGFTGRFEKGHVPANAGKKMSDEHYQKCAPTMFKKGNTPINHREVGSERINVDGYIEIKVAEPSKWRLKHRVVYEKEHGAIPKGCVVKFLDGNRLNVSPENLVLISRSTNQVLNQRHMAKTESAELNRAAINTAELMAEVFMAIRKHKAGGQDSDRGQFCMPVGRIFKVEKS